MAFLQFLLHAFSFPALLLMIQPLLSACNMCEIIDLFDDLVVEDMEFCFECKLVTTLITLPANCSTA